MEKIYLAYCRENADLADLLDQKLSRVGIPFQHISNQPGMMPGQFAARVQSTTDPVLLFVTDNFLKNQNCMASALTMLRQLVRNQRVLPIVADGKMQQDGQWVAAPTQFDRVIHAIQYMNYWQSTFLEMRGKRDAMPREEQDGMDQKINTVREIGAEIGEFLNQLRDSEFVQWTDFQTNDFELFFRKFGILDWHEQYRQIAMFDDEQDFLQAAVEPQQNVVEVLNLDDVEKQAATPPAESSWQAATTNHHEPQRREIWVEKPTPQPEELAPQGESVAASTATASLAAPLEFSEMDDLIEEIVREEQEFQQADFSEIENLASLAPPEVAPAEFEEAPNFATADFSENPNFEFQETQPQVQNSSFENLETPSVSSETRPEPTVVFQIENLEKLEIPAVQVVVPQAVAEVSQQPRALQFLESSPDLPAEAQYDWLMILARTGRQNEALVFLENHHLDENDRPTAQNFEWRGDICQAAGEVYLAKDFWEKAAFLEPALPGIYLKLGELTDQHFRGSKKSAAEYLKLAADQDPENPKIHYRLASMLLEHLDKPKRAIRYLLNTVALEKNHPTAWLDLAHAYLETGDPERAETCYHRAAEINPAVRTMGNDRLFLLNFQKTKIVETAAAPKPPAISVVDKIFTVLITGATSGIGRATAEIFSKNGHRVLLAGRRTERLEEIKDSFSKNYGNDCHLLSFDVRRFEEVKNALDSLPEDWREIDILINNAGLAKGLDDIHEGNLDHWETMIDTNLKGLLYMTRLVSPAMVARRSGHIINVGSSAGKEVYPKGNVYCATKFAVDALSRAMRVDLHKFGVRVSQVSPGHVEETEFALNRFDGDSERAKIYSDFQPLKSSDVAEAIYFMATRPPHVNVQDLYLFGSQQANSMVIDRSGRE